MPCASCSAPAAPSAHLRLFRRAPALYHVPTGCRSPADPRQAPRARRCPVRPELRSQIQGVAVGSVVVTWLPLVDRIVLTVISRLPDWAPSSPKDRGMTI